MDDIFPERVSIDTQRNIEYYLGRTNNYKNVLIDLLAGSESVIENIYHTEGDDAQDYELRMVINARDEALYNFGTVHPLSAIERLVLMFLIGAQGRNDSTTRELTIVTKYLCELVPSLKQRKTAINQAIRSLWENSFIYYDAGKLITSRIFISTYESVEDTVNSLLEVRLNDKLFDAIANFKNGNYTQISMDQVLKLKDAHRALYIQIKYLTSYNRKQEIYLTREKIQQIFKNKRSRFPSFKNDILKPAMEEISLKTDVDITIEELNMKEKKLLVKQRKERNRRYKGTIKDFEIRIKLTNKFEADIREKVMKAKENILGRSIKIKGIPNEYKILDVTIDALNQDYFSVKAQTHTGNEFTRIIACQDFYNQFKSLTNKVDLPLCSYTPKFK